MRTQIRKSTRPSPKIPDVYIIGVFLLSALLVGFITEATRSGAGAVGAFLLYIGYCAFLSQRLPATFTLLSPLLFLRTTEVFAGIPIEFGVYLTELSTNGTPTGSTGRLVAFYILCFSLCGLVIEPYWRKRKDFFYSKFSSASPANIIFISFLLIVGLATTYTLYFGFANGFPLIDGTDRFKYRTENADRIVNEFLANRYLIALFAGIFLMDAKKRISTALLILYILVVSVLFGEKFGSISLILILLSLPAALKRVYEKGRLPLKSIFIYPAVIVCVTLPIVFIVYGGLTNSSQAFTDLFGRMASQGQLWHIVDAKYASFADFKYDVIEKDIASWFNPAAQDPMIVGSNFGQYYLMSHVAPSDITYQASQQGTGYVFSLFPYILMISGWTGLLLIGPLTYLIFAAFMLLLFEQISKTNFLNIIICSKLFVFLISGGFTVGYLWFFFGIKTIALLLVVFAIDWLMSNARSQKVMLRTAGGRMKSNTNVRSRASAPSRPRIRQPPE